MQPEITYQTARKKLYIINFICLCLLFAPVTGYSKTNSASIVINADNGNIIYEDNANQLWFPASLTKVMTLYLVFKALKYRQIKLKDKLIVSKLAANQPPFKLGLIKGQSLTIEQAILAVATRSANDAAFVLAEHQGKTEKNFALKMTIQAKALGMNNTKFYNVTGLPNAKQVTTAHDMAILAQSIQHDFPKYYHYFSTPHFTYNKRYYANINRILTAYSGADGLKTGFTCGSGYNLIASAKRKNQRVIAVVMGAKNNHLRTTKMIDLLNKGFSKTSTIAVPKNISAPRPKSLVPAPYILSTSQCHQTYTASSYKNRISGWSIVFGAFPKKSQAKKLINKIKPKLGNHAKLGHPVIIKRMRNGVMLWHALWSGLKKTQAGKTCKTLWAAGEYCRAMHPIIFSKKNLP
jgi:D-alanyl-D-alanine carboxypeptidase